MKIVVFNKINELILLIMFLSIMLANHNLLANADNQCAWIPTYNKPISEIVSYIEKRTGKKPGKSCGGGEDFKVCFECVDRLERKDWLKIQKMLATSSFKNWHSSWHSQFNDRLSNKINQTARGLINVNENSLRVNYWDNFLLMHREIIRSVQANLAAQGLPCISGWEELPKKADDPKWKIHDYMGLENDKLDCDELDEETKNKIRNYIDDFNATKKLVKIDDEYDSKFKQIIQKYSKLNLEKDWIPLINTMEDELGKLENNYLKLVRINSRSLRRKYNVDSNFFIKYNICNKDYYEKELHRIQSVHDVYYLQVSKTLKPEFINKNSLGAVGLSIGSNWHSALLML